MGCCLPGDVRNYGKVTPETDLEDGELTPMWQEHKCRGGIALNLMALRRLRAVLMCGGLSL